MNINLSHLSGSFALILILIISPISHAENQVGRESKPDSIDVLTAQLIKLRGEVDDLSTELNLSREEHKQRMKYLYVQKNELLSQHDKALASIERLNNKLLEHQQYVREFGADSAQLKPVLISSIKRIENYISTGLPYKVEQRINALNELKSQITSDVISGQAAANRLWSLLEDEISLTKENGLFRQIVNIDGEDYLSSIARVGMMLLYFKTSDGVYGKAEKQSGQWSYVVLKKSQDKQDIDQLFDAYEKQIRTGYFNLPAASLL